MRRRWWWVPAAVLLGVMVWSLATENPVAAWLVDGAWAVFFVAVIVKTLRPSAQGHRTRSVAEPAFGGLDEVQNIYLGRPDVGPVAYGSTGPSETELVIDRAEPDPGDLSQADHRA